MKALQGPAGSMLLAVDRKNARVPVHACILVSGVVYGRSSPSRSFRCADTNAGFSGVHVRNECWCSKPCPST